MAVDASDAGIDEGASDNRRNWTFVERHGLLLVAVSPVIANLIGSAFNIWYNHRQIEPQLSAVELARFGDCWLWYNAIIYPLAVGCWVAPLVMLRPVHQALLAGEPVPDEQLTRAQRIVVNLPWRILLVASFSWILCIPIFSMALAMLPGPLAHDVWIRLAISFVTGGLIAITHSFFAVELASQKALFRVYFRRHSPAEVPGARPLTIRARGFMWALSASVAPVVILVLLMMAPEGSAGGDDAARADRLFTLAVAAVEIAFSLATGHMLSRLIAVPVHQLKNAAIRVADGDLDVRVNLQRADDFGPLISRFNQMIEGLRQRERLQETFGRHVGQEAARQILAQGDGLGGNCQDVTVMFVDVRNFTAYSADHSPEEVVSALNIFFRDAVETVESHGGMVNKFLGDGFMALFGIGKSNSDHPQAAFQAALAMGCRLADASEELAKAGWPELKIGIGLNTGPAIVGSIGSPRRQEYTAIGDTVNVAARVEALTKALGCCLLITAATRARLPADLQLKRLPPQEVKGKDEALVVYSAGGSNDAGG